MEENHVVFCLDSGATKHFISDLSLLQDNEEVDEFSIMNSFGAKDVGNISGNFQGELDNGLEVVLNDVLYTGKIGANILSIQELNKHGFTVEFRDHTAFIRSQTELTFTKLKIMVLTTKLDSRRSLSQRSSSKLCLTSLIYGTTAWDIFQRITWLK